MPAFLKAQVQRGTLHSENGLWVSTQVQKEWELGFTVWADAFQLQLCIEKLETILIGSLSHPK